MEECLFCKIIRGEIPSKKVYDDKDVYAFLDINPANKGHTLVIPKKHAENIMAANEGDLAKCVEVVKKIATLQKENLKAEGVNVLQNNGKYAGQIVSHVHFHVIPRFQNDQVVITYQRAQVTEKDMEDVRKQLSGEAPASNSAPPTTGDPKDFDLDF